MKEKIKNFYIINFINLLISSLLIILTGYFMAHSSLPTTHLFGIIVPKYYPQIIFIIWILALINFMTIIVKSENSKLVLKSVIAILSILTLFCITIAGLVLIGSIYQELNYFDTLSDFIGNLNIINDNFFGTFVIPFNICAIIATALVIRDVIKSKLDKYNTIITIGLTILLVIMMIIIQGSLYEVVKYLGFSYPKNTFETLFALIWILIFGYIKIRFYKSDKSKQ